METLLCLTTDATSYLTLNRNLKVPLKLQHIQWKYHTAKIRICFFILETQYVRNCVMFNVQITIVKV